MGFGQSFRAAVTQTVVGWARTLDPNAFPDYPSYWRNIPVPLSNFALDYPRAVAAVPIVYACIDLLATDAASLPVRFYRRLPDGKRQPIEREAGNITDLWERANPQQSRYELTVELQSALDTSGNAYLFVETYGQDKPSKDWELWHMPPHVVKPTVTDHRVPVAYEFMGGIAPILIDAARVIHFRYPHPQFSPVGLSPLEAARIAYESRYLGDRWNRQFFERGGQVAHMFEMPAESVNRDPKWLEKEQQRMAERFGGIKNVGLPTILQGMKFVRAGLTHAEMGFVDSMKMIDTDVCLVFGIPPSVLNIRTGGSLSDAGISVDWVRYWENAQKRRARLRDAVLTKHLCSRFGPDIECETDFSAVPAIQEQLLKQMKSLVIATGRPVLDVNEARRPLAEVFGIGPRDDETEEADKLFLPSAPEAGMPAPKGGEEPAGSGPGEEGEDALGQVTGITDGEVKPRPGKAAKSAQADRMKEAALIERVRVRKRASALLARYERRFERAMRTFFAEQEARTLTNLEHAWQMGGYDTGRNGHTPKRNGVGQNGIPHRDSPHIEWATLLDAGGHVDVAALERIFSDLMDQRGEDQLAELGVEVEIELNKAATTHYAAKQAAALVGQINETTRGKLRESLGAVLQAGGTYTEAYAAVQGVFEGRRGNAGTIARTEMAGAFNYAGLDAARQSGVVTGKSWLTTDDELVRESHSECEAEGEIAVDDEFTNGLQFPGDPDGDPEDVCNCRCTLLYGTDETRVRRLKERVASTGRKLRMADPLPDVPLEEWLECLKR